jgi:hypothetical protein
MRLKLGEAMPAILTAVGCVGVLGTAVCAVRDSKKAVRKLDDLGLYDTLEKPSLKTEAKATWKCYLPTIGAATITIGSIVMARRLSVKQIASLTAAAGYLSAKACKYKDKIREIAGGDVLKKVDEEFGLGELAKHPSFEETGNGDLICFEGYSGRWFKSSEEAVREAMQRVADRFGDGEYLAYNDIYDELGIVKTHFGNEFGYAPGSDFFDFNFYYDVDVIPYEDLTPDTKPGIPEGAPVLIIDIYTYPMQCWMEV